MRALVIVFVAVACSGGGGKSKQPAKPAGTLACESAMAGLEKREKLTDAHRKAVVARCVEDEWSAEAKSCLAKAFTKDAADKCTNTLLTVGQLEEIEKAVGRGPAKSTDKPAEPTDSSLALTEISPARGDAEGGTYTVITGTGFQEPSREAKVYFGTKEGEVVRISEDAMIVRSPAGKAGDTVDIKVVFQPGGTRILKGAFKYNAARSDSWDPGD